MSQSYRLAGFPVLSLNGTAFGTHSGIGGNDKRGNFVRQTITADTPVSLVKTPVA
ncbi:hypothetical protein ACH4TE_17535 [Streptomyces sioyaensis]|uniref:hypothetical protein n=1 Tax=Streptomyces sioyaensis TaxID=67364 RepID=UPI0037990CEE